MTLLVYTTVQQHNLHHIECVNQSHHIFRLAKLWEICICNTCARWALFQISCRPQLKIEAKLGMGGQSIVGPLSQDYSNRYLQLKCVLW